MCEDSGKGFIWVCSPWLVRRILEPCVAAKKNPWGLWAKSGNILLVGVIFGIRALLTGSSMMRTGSLGFLRWWIVISNISGWGFGGAPYISMLTLINKTCFGVMRGCQEKNLWGSWIKVDNILLKGCGVTKDL